MSKQITLKLGPDSAAMLAKMEAMTGGDTTNVIQNALRIYLWLAEEHAQGHQFLIRDPESGVTKIQVFQVCD